MLSCTEFIPAYSELFKFLEARGGEEEVLTYWNHISDAYVLPTLGPLAKERGIRGCWDYWSKALNEEAADFRMTLDEDAGVYASVMRRCPSKGHLMDFTHIEPYHNYCGHCDVLYRRVLEPLGFQYDFDMTRVDEAACSCVIRLPAAAEKK